MPTKLKDQEREKCCHGMEITNKSNHIQALMPLHLYTKFSGHMYKTVAVNEEQ